MAPPATEIALLPLVTGADIEDPNSSAGKIWQSSLDTIAAQPGYKGAFWGRQVENNSVLELLIGMKNPASDYLYLHQSLLLNFWTRLG